MTRLTQRRFARRFQNAVRANQTARAAKLPNASPHTPSVHRQQTAVINSIRAHLAESGIVAPVGRKGVTDCCMLLPIRATNGSMRLPVHALPRLAINYSASSGRFWSSDRMIMAWYRSNHYIPGVGPMLATALVASVADPRTSRSAGNFAAWIGLVPKQHSSGARIGSAASANRAIAIYAACSQLVHWPSSATPRCTAASIGPGSPRCWHGARPRSPPSRLPTRLRGWLGP
jgi:Transposase IS116/IS110/IS902 family